MCSIHRGWARRFGTGSYWWDQTNRFSERWRIFWRTVSLFGIVGSALIFFSKFPDFVKCLWLLESSQSMLKDLKIVWQSVPACPKHPSPHLKRSSCPLKIFQPPFDRTRLDGERVAAQECAVHLVPSKWEDADCYFLGAIELFDWGKALPKMPELWSKSLVVWINGSWWKKI